MPPELNSVIDAVCSTPIVNDDLGVISHRFDQLPNFTADLVYLDGPDHDQVKGEIRGFSYDDSFTQPMGSDLLYLEPFFLARELHHYGWSNSKRSILGNASEKELANSS